jgi:hypothetical protein
LNNCTRLRQGRGCPRWQRLKAFYAAEVDETPGQPSGGVKRLAVEDLGAQQGQCVASRETQARAHRPIRDRLLIRPGAVCMRLHQRLCRSGQASQHVKTVITGGHGDPFNEAAKDSRREGVPRSLVCIGRYHTAIGGNRQACARIGNDGGCDDRDQAVLYPQHHRPVPGQHVYAALVRRSAVVIGRR